MSVIPRRSPAGTDLTPGTSTRDHPSLVAARGGKVVTSIEVAVAVSVVLADVAIPSLVLAAMALGSLAIRRTGFASLGFHRAPAMRLVGTMFAFAAGWSLFQLGVTMPIANHVSGRKTDLSDFADLEGNLPMLIGLLVLSWTVAALGEELAFRGYLLTRIRELIDRPRLGLVVAVAISSLLFGVLHAEQGVIGVVVITLDAVAFSVLRHRCGTLWAPVLAHGFNNTIGFVAFFFLGPVHGLW